MEKRKRLGVTRGALHFSAYLQQMRRPSKASDARLPRPSGADSARNARSADLLAEIALSAYTGAPPSKGDSSSGSFSSSGAANFGNSLQASQWLESLGHGHCNASLGTLRASSSDTKSVSHTLFLAITFPLQNRKDQSRIENCWIFSSTSRPGHNTSIFRKSNVFGRVIHSPCRISIFLAY